MMVNKIIFKNYKSFKEEQVLEIKPITVLIGKNSSGKSAIAKLPTLLEGSLSGSFSDPLLLKNDGVEIGAEYRDIIYGRLSVGTVEFKLEFDDNILEVKIASTTGSNSILKIVSWKLGEEIDLQYDDSKKAYLNTVDEEFYHCEFMGFNLMAIVSLNRTSPEIPIISSQKFATDYIGPYRAIPERSYEAPNQREITKVGIDGRKAYDVLINDSLTLKKVILNQVSEWYKQRFENWGLEVTKNSTQPFFYFEMVRDNPNLKINIKDVGQGFSQILPLVTRALMPTMKPTLIIIEEPELHLHPGAHGDLAQLFSDSLDNGSKRYLIETHSQNFILRLRRLVAEGKLDKDKLVIYWIESDKMNGASNLKRIDVDEQGRVNYWPENVFSETLDETVAIRTAQKRNSKDGH